MQVLLNLPEKRVYYYVLLLCAKCVFHLKLTKTLALPCMTAAVHLYSTVREPASIRACQLQHLHISYDHSQGTSKVSVEYSQHSVFPAKVAPVYELNAPGCDCSSLKHSLPHGFGSQLEGSRSVAGAKAGLSNGTRRRQTATRPQRGGVAEVLTQQLRKRAYGIITVWAFKIISALQEYQYIIVMKCNSISSYTCYTS